MKWFEWVVIALAWYTIMTSYGLDLFALRERLSSPPSVDPAIPTTQFGERRPDGWRGWLAAGCLGLALCALHAAAKLGQPSFYLRVFPPEQEEGAADAD